MGQSEIIHNYTLLFIDSHAHLRENGKIEDADEFRNKLKIGSRQILSNILAKRNNINPASWKLFLEHYRQMVTDKELRRKLEIEAETILGTPPPADVPTMEDPPLDYIEVSEIKNMLRQQDQRAEARHKESQDKSQQIIELLEKLLKETQKGNQST